MHFPPDPLGWRLFMARRRRSASNPEAGAELEVAVERLINGPGALARAPDGRVVLLDAGLPGEWVRVRVVSARRDLLEARVVRPLGEPSPQRREPPCPVVALCGGCPWQMLEDGAQVLHKQEVVLREVRRVLPEGPAVVRPPLTGPPWRTRHRIRLAVERPGTERVALGYRRRGSREIVPIEDCPIARAELTAALPLARALAAVERSVREIELSVDDRGGLRLLGVCASRSPRPAEDVRAAVEAAAKQADLGSATFAGLALVGERSWRREAGDVDQFFAVAPDVDVRVPIGTFTQVNPELNRSLVARVRQECAGPPGRQILDLFCGAGNFSLALARDGARVHGIDGDPRAIAAACASASALDLDGNVHFRTASVDRETLASVAGPVDLVVLDPPRAGAAAVPPALAMLRPQKVVYVSCDVATFARDARAIVERGGRFASLQMIDLTPQTHRAEVLGVFQLTWERSGPYRDG